MRKTTLLAVAGLALAAAGCVVHEREVVTERPAQPNCRGAVWVEEGNRSHWACPATEQVDVKIVP